MRKLPFLAVALLPLSLLAQEGAPDLIITNAKVYTADPANKSAEAIAIRGNRIVGVGTSEQIASMGGSRTLFVDAKKHLVVPGFNDAHTHQSPTFAEQFALSLNPDPSWEDLAAALNNATEETPEGPWIVGTIGPKLLADPNVNAAALDKASHNRKVVLREVTGHGIILSGTAMQALRVNGSDVAGGWFGHDASGRLNGKLFEYADLNAGRRIADDVSDADATDQLRAYVNDALQHGVTTIQNMSYQSILHYDKIVRHSEPPIRIRMIRFPGTTAQGPDLTEGATMPVTSRERPLAVISGWKWILDGTPVERGAAVRTPYPNSTEKGRLNFTPEQLQVLAKAAFESKDQWLFHAVGDQTTAALFDAMRAVAPPEQWRAKRVRIEHGDGLLPDLIPVAKDFGVVVVVNPTHLAARGLYPKGAYMPVRALLKAGVPVAIGSDTNPDPFRDIALVTGNDPEAISREEAIDLFTSGSAYAELAENDKGTIANGKLADLAILSEDILKAPADRLASARSLLTIVDGKVVYDGGVLSAKRRD
jgi:predicted amidohydrolase YtcJ